MADVVSGGMKRRVATLFLDEILILENGRTGDGDAENIVLTSLIWPRPMIDLRTAARSLRLEDGERIGFAHKPFHEKILFKEMVGGPFGITVEVTERKSPGAIAQFLSSIASSLLDAAFPLPPSSETFRRIVHAGVAGIGGRVQSGPKETLARVAFGHGLIDPAEPGPGQIEIQMTAPETISGSGAQSKRAPILTKGQPNGQAIIRYVIEED